MILGLRTVIYKVPDLAKAKAWYASVLGFEPYFAEPFYVGFQVGGFELGLDPDMAGASPGGAVVAYWGVEDVAAEYARVRALGAGEGSPPQDVGGGIRVAVVTDPFGNAFGLIQNPHFATENVR
ncbi:MAG TPA: VOC family protein [Thermoanaerobaculia bacterium]|nr:VOC family protein [Thermoanaerobaculia bacterium]